MEDEASLKTDMKIAGRSKDDWFCMHVREMKPVFVNLGSRAEACLGLEGLSPDAILVSL